MKRFVLFVLVLILGATSLACAEDDLHWLSPTIGGNDAVMIVNNGSDWNTKLNLRAEQRMGSKIKGRIYTGTRVEVYQDNGEWCTVGLNFGGGYVLTGDVMKQYLTPLRNAFYALCPLAVAKTETEVLMSIDMTVAHLQPGDTAYVMAVCGERYFLMVPGKGQGYAPVDAFEELAEPPEEKRIVYRSFYVPEGGLCFADEYTGDTVFLEGGVLLEDCWQISGEKDWHVTFGAGIQRTPRVQATLPEAMFSVKGSVPFEGAVFAQGESFITCLGEINEQRILRRNDPNGDVFWALGEVPANAVRLDRDLYMIKCEAEELLSQATIKSIVEYIGKRGVLDERTEGVSVSDEVLKRCTVHTSLGLEPGEGDLLYIHVWLADEDGSYVTGGDLDPKTGEIIRWGCNA